MISHYWWASQGKNYPIAIAQDILWSCPNEIHTVDEPLDPPS